MSHAGKFKVAMVGVSTESAKEYLPELFYSRVAKPMREALKEKSFNVTGLEAEILLRYYLCSRSLEWLKILLERYPEHVVEFSSYGVNWGTLRGYNTVFWEVRLY